ncbi:MAG: DUF763 domain-containing protein [Acidilobus sp.]
MVTSEFGRNGWMTGAAELPLHDGHVPPSLLRVMRELSRSIVKVIVEEEGPDKLVRALSDPVWFQAFNNVIGMDWDSSGSTTVVLSVLKEVSWSDELGFLILGGKGRKMLRLKDETKEAERRYGLDPSRLFTFSKVSARAASTFLQDGYDTYVHALVVSEGGETVVIQQGMNLGARMARRYHIDKGSIEEPFSGVAGISGPVILNATARESREARKAYLDIIAEGKERFLRLLSEANAALGAPSLLRYIEGEVKVRPPRAYYRPVIPSRQFLRMVENMFSSQPGSEGELAVTPGLGPKVVRALALVADLVYSVPTSVRDPVTVSLDPFAYAYAVGGKDGVPYPYDRETALRVIEYLRQAIEEARVGNTAKLAAMARLRAMTARLGGLP